MSNNNLDFILDKSIIWNVHEENKRYYYAYFNNGFLLLRINNFPDEPMYTVIYEKYISDLDELPNQWVVL